MKTNYKSHQSDIMLILDFEQHNIQLFQSLLEAVAPDLECRSKSRDTNVLSTVWLLSNDESYRGVADSLFCHREHFTTFSYQVLRR